MARRLERSCLFSLGLVLSALWPGPTAAAEGSLHVPSPDWRDQIIYFAMIDRFDDGDPSNNDQGAAEYDPASNAKYNGGDLRGIERRLDYIRGLGATALWITPPVANQWWNVRGNYGGYHGYWAENLVEVDAHVGSLQDYQSLSRALHAAGMYLVQDVVVNHMGNYYGYRGLWDPAHPERNFVVDADSHGRSAPTQPPFDRNDVRKPADREAAIYHWTPAITDYNDPQQIFAFQLADLDDLNTENPVVREALRRSYGYWILEVGVDGFRVDTAFYVPPDYFDDFLDADDARAPGILRVAADSGRERFHAFGEGFAMDKPYSEEQAKRIDGYMRRADGKALLPGMINFPLYGTTLDVIARGRPPAELAYRIESTMRVHAQPHLMPTFVDNHDVDRFLAGGSQAALQQALLLIMTLPGIPTIYYGTEQGFSEPRAAMFASGYGSGGKDRFDVTAPLYRYLQRAIALRREHKLFSRGTPTVLKANRAVPGALVYRMVYEGVAAIVVFNTADHDSLLDNFDTGLPVGTRLQGLFGIDATPKDLAVAADGRIHLRLPPRSGLVWTVGKDVVANRAPPSTPTLDTLANDKVSDDFEVAGAARGATKLQLVVDGDLAHAQTVVPDRDGRWRGKVDTSRMVDPLVEHELVAWHDATATASESRKFRVARDWSLLADVADALDDDVGPQGRYRYPGDAGWGSNRQLDIERVRVYGAGAAMKLELQMRKLTALWNPANGFDHVAFTIFIQAPGTSASGTSGGVAVMPLQNATLPQGMRWDYRLRAHGWTNAMFASAGASKDSEGTAITPAPTIEADLNDRTVVLTIPASAFGALKSLSGAKLYVTTWDYDGGYRPLTPEAQSQTFGGGNGAVDPLVMDDLVITLP